MNTLPSTLTPRQLQDRMKPRCPKVGEAELLYEVRDTFVTQLKAKGAIGLDDITKLDRSGRCIVASDYWTICSSEARQSLLDDAHHFVRSTAEISQRETKAH